MEERNELIKELFELHKLLADKGEISIGYGFSENYERLEAKVKKLTIPVVAGRSEQFNFKKGDYLTYIGGSATKYLQKGNKYRTTWDGTNGFGRVAVIGIDKKRLVMPIRFFTI